MIFIVSMDDARIASYDIAGAHFEIFVEPVLALEIRKGAKEVLNNLGKLLAVEEVYKCARSGTRVSEKALNEHFGTTDLTRIVTVILEKGHLDLTTDQKRRLAEEKRRELINYIVKNSINPVTKAPHTPQRVESALDATKIAIDIQKPISVQANKIIEKMSAILPMDFKICVCRTKVPIAFVGKVNGVINRYEITDRKWEPDYFCFVAKVPAGEKGQFLNMISGLTKGQAQFDFE